MIDYSRYCELLQSAQNLKKQEKNLYFENEKKYLELSGYRGIKTLIFRQLFPTKLKW
jgi:hypothetical protein